MGTEGWGLVIIGVIEVIPVLTEFGLAVQRRSQPKNKQRWSAGRVVFEPPGTVLVQRTVGVSIILS